MTRPRKPAKPRRGRPPLPPGEVRTERLEIRLTEDEAKRLAASAEQAGESTSEYARNRMLSEKE